MAAPIPPSEPRRLAALERYKILDTCAEEAFDDIVRIAARVCGTPIALVTLVDRARQWFKARIGFDVPETAREHAFCAHAVCDQEVMVVNDALSDVRFAANPLVLEDPKIRFYAGAPLVTPEGHSLGTLCVIDREPRRLTAEEIEVLQRLAREAMAQLELRRTLLEVDEQLQAASTDDRLTRVNGALDRGERRFRALMQHSSDSVALVDAEGRIVYGSPSTRKLLGYETAEFVGRDALDFVHAEDRPFVAQKLRESTARPSVMVNVFTRILHKDGRWRLMEAVLTNMLDDPHVRAIVANYRDVTDVRRVEEELRQSQKMDAVGRLAGGVAHDFNNLLTAILGYNEILRMKAVDDEMTECVDEIRRAGERAASLTQQLLAFSRRQSLQPRILDLNALVHGLEKMLRRLIGEHIALEVRPSVPLPSIRADHSQIEQVVMNLVVNARDAMPRGGRITIRTAAVEGSTVVDVPPGRYVELGVSDTGEGIPPEALDRIFEPFFTTKAPGKGTGLGLSTVYGIVRQSLGHVTVDNRPGKGASFRIFLPAVDTPAPAAAASQPAPPETRTSGRILLVEDEDSVRRLLAITLREAGFEVLEARNGAEAVATAEKHADLDAVVCDVVMPVMNGPEAVDRIRRLRPRLPVLFTSGYSDEVLEEVVRNTALPVLRKPFLPSKLVEELRSLIKA